MELSPPPDIRPTISYWHLKRKGMDITFRLGLIAERSAIALFGELRMQWPPNGAFHN